MSEAVIVLTPPKLKDLLDCSFEVGYHTAVRAYEPTGDFVRKSEITAWLRHNFIDEKMFRRLVRSGEIKEYKGETPNSPTKYSIADIKKAITVVRVLGLKR